MIVAQLNKPDGSSCLVMILGPENVAKINSGEPLLKQLNEFLKPHVLTEKVELMLMFTPDIKWVVDQMRDKPRDAEALMKAVADSQSRTEAPLPGNAHERLVPLVAAVEAPTKFLEPCERAAIFSGIVHQAWKHLSEIEIFARMCNESIEWAVEAYQEAAKRGFIEIEPAKNPN